MQTKFNYTSGGEFQLNGTDYIGYISIDHLGNVYSGKYIDDNSVMLLDLNSMYSNDYNRSEYFKDRLVFDEINLPYDLEDMLIQPNELVNFSNLNTKFYYLHKNLLYLYSRMFTGDTSVPVEYDKTIANYLDSNLNYNFGWYNEYGGYKTNITEHPTLNIYPQFDYIKKFIVIPFTDNSGISIIGISDTHIIGLTSTYTENFSLNNASFVLYTNLIDDSNNLETFKQIEDIVYDGQYLYVSDSKVNVGGQIFKYNINSFFSKNSVFNYSKYFLEPIGGFGGTDRYNKFNNCSILGTKPDELWVYDSGNFCIKIYDSNFVFKKFIKTNDYKILDIRYRKMDKCMYLLTEFLYNNKLEFGLLVYNENFNLIKKVKFNDVLNQFSDIRFNRFAISEQDSNVFYVTTDTCVFKKFFSKPEETFAIFNREKFYLAADFSFSNTDLVFGDSQYGYTYNYNRDYNFSQKVKDVFLLGYDDRNYDDLFLLGTGFVSHFREKTNYDCTLRDSNLNYYNFDEISLDKNEYVQTFVINKEFYKIYSNTIQLINYMRGKFLFEFDKYGNLINKDIIYFTNSEISKLIIDIDYNSYINDNELVNPNVINRVIRQLYKVQTNLLFVTKIKLSNFKTVITSNESNILNIS